MVATGESKSYRGNGVRTAMGGTVGLCLVCRKEELLDECSLEIIKKKCITNFNIGTIGLGKQTYKKRVGGE